ncbi:MAG: MucB/RseB C-terminal domain-containing protein [Gammaproteobacteria bacterium]|jgi:sigma-E factor negative regulatory protein RseB
MRSSRAPVVFLALAAGLVCGAGRAADQDRTPQQWLDLMGDAVQSRNYEGTFVYRHDEKLETMRIVHRADDDGESERLVSLNGSAREVIRHGDTLRCILPDDRSILVQHSQRTAPFPARLPADTGNLAGHYEFLDLGTDRIANRECKVIGVKPKDGYRYGYRLWLDRATGLPLRSDLIGEKGHTVEQVMFTSFSTPASIPDSELKPDADARDFVVHVRKADKQSAKEGEPRHWQVNHLPPGFEINMNQIQHLAGGNSVVRHMVFSDGLASVSLFAEPVDGGKDVLRGLARMGAVNAYGRVVDGFQITVVGEVPAATVKMIGESVQRMAPPAESRLK